MKNKHFLVGNQGFTLVELMVVTVIMGLVVAGIYGVFLSMNKNTYMQEEVVEVQQNLRVAMSRIAFDIRMAGFEIPTGQSAIQVADVDTISLRTASISGRVAQVAVNFAATTNEKTVTVASEEMIDLFDTTDHQYVRIIRPLDKNQPIESVFTVIGKDRTSKELTISGFGPASPVQQYLAGDSIVEVGSTASVHPEVISYQLQANGNLERNGQTVGSYITSIEFEYLTEDGSVLATPVSAVNIDDIKAVRVTMTGATDPVKKAITDGVKSRQLTQVVRIRNQR